MIARVKNEGRRHRREMGVVTKNEMDNLHDVRTVKIFTRVVDIQIDSVIKLYIIYSTMIHNR